MLWLNHWENEEILPLLQSCTSKWASRNWHYKGPLWHQRRISPIWRNPMFDPFFRKTETTFVGWKTAKIRMKQPEATNHKRWLELNRDWYIHYMWWQDVKGQRMSLDLLQPLIEFRIIWRQQSIIWRKLWLLTLKDSMAYGGSLANFPIFPEPNLGISWEFHDIAGKKPDDHQERIGNSSRRLGFSPTRIGLEKSSNSSKKMKMLTNKTVIWTRMGSPWITRGIETPCRDSPKQQWNSHQWDGDWRTIKDVICWLAHTVQHRVSCTSRWLDLRENIQEVRCSTMRIYRNLAKNHLFHMNWREIWPSGPNLHCRSTAESWHHWRRDYLGHSPHVRMKKGTHPIDIFLKTVV